MQRGTSTEHVTAVLAIDDRVLRNYWVTQSYSDLADRLTTLLAPGTANWCTFGTWASCTVGRNLRGEDLPGWLHSRVVLADGMMGVARSANDNLRQAGLDRLLHEIEPHHLDDVVRERFGACATNLSDGNTEVFAEIAPAAATFLECFSNPAHDPAAARAAVMTRCDGAPEFEGINRLRAGFTHWCDALAEPDPTRRSQRTLAGSLELGAHEQHHLQSAIAGAMDMGMNQSAAALLRRVAKDLRAVAGLEAAITDALHPATQAMSDLWGDLMTELLGTIQTPDGTLHLNGDVPPIPGTPFVPSDLEPVVVDDLAALLQRFNRADRDGRGSRAPDWVSLDDRMNFISNLFLSRHHRSQLFQPPFGVAVLAQIEADRIPTTDTGADRRAVSSQPNVTPTVPVVPPSKGVSMFTDEFVERLQGIGDPPADAAVAEFFKVTQAKHTELFQRLSASTAQRLADEDLPGIGTFVRHEEPWPNWANPDLVREGQQVFGDFGPQIGMGLFMASLPADYAFAKGVQVLGRTTRLTRDPKRRYVETGQMIVDAMTPGALEPGGVGYRSVRHVRLMHAAVRHVLVHIDEVEQYGTSIIEPWDAALGMPINQLQLLGTLFSFGVQGIEALGRSGVRLGEQRSEAYIHVWNLIGHQMGILDELLPLSWADSKALWDDRRRREYGPTEEGRALTKAAIECMNELFALTFMPGLPATGIRHYLGNETADTLGVPKSDWTRAIFELMSRTDWMYGVALDRLPVLAPIASVLGQRIWRGFELYGRGGERPAFRVTDELKEAWGMKT